MSHMDIWLCPIAKRMSSCLEMAQSNLPPDFRWTYTVGALLWPGGEKKGCCKNMMFLMRPVGNAGGSWGGKKEVTFSKPSSATLTPSSSSMPSTSVIV